MKQQGLRGEAMSFIRAAEAGGGINRFYAKKLDVTEP